MLVISTPLKKDNVFLGLSPVFYVPPVEMGFSPEVEKNYHVAWDGPKIPQLKRGAPLYNNMYRYRCIYKYRYGFVDIDIGIGIDIE